MGKWDDPDYRREYFRKYREAHAEKIATYQREYRSEHLEEKRQGDREYAAAHREQAKAKARAWYYANPDRAKATRKAWREARKKPQPSQEEIEAAKALRKQKHREYMRTYIREYYRKHPELNRARAKAWAAANPDRVREQSLRSGGRYRARINGGIIEPVNREAVIARDKSICGLCGKFVPADQMSLDHIYPVSLGGAHAEWNLQVAHLHCNKRKSAGRIPSQTRLPL